MKNFKYSFRSIMVNHVEKVIPGTIFSKMVLEMDDSNVEKHEMEITLSEILKDTAWITNLFLSIMIVVPVSAVLYGGLYFTAGRTMNQSLWSVIKFSLLAADIIIFCAIWIALSSKVSIDNKKRRLVESRRGKGNWRLVSEDKWDNFNRLLLVAKNQRESEKIIK